MAPEKKSLVMANLLITVGIGWLLTAMGIAPAVNWVWSLALGAIGLSTLAVAGIDKVTAVVGPFFILASGLSLLRQSGRLDFDVEVPILVITAGVLLLIARSTAIPAPRWVTQESSVHRPD